MQIVYSPKSLEDLERIRQRVLGRYYNPQEAMRVVGRLFAAVDGLSVHLEQTVALKADVDLLSGYRQCIVGEYAVICRFHLEDLRVVRILDCVQDEAAKALQQ